MRWAKTLPLTQTYRKKMTTEPADATIQEEAKSSSKDLSFRLKAGAFGAAVAATKRQDPGHFDAGMVGLDPAASKAINNTRYQMNIWLIV